MAAVHPDDVVLGGGRAKKLGKLPKGCRLGDNAKAFTGGFRLWEDEKRSEKEEMKSRTTMEQIASRPASSTQGVKNGSKKKEFLRGKILTKSQLSRKNNIL